MLVRLLLALLVVLQAVPPVGLCAIAMAARSECVEAAPCAPVSCCAQPVECPAPVQPPCQRNDSQPLDCCLLGPCAPGPYIPSPAPDQPARLVRLPYLALVPLPTPARASISRAPHEGHAIAPGRLRPTLCIWVI